MSSAAEFENATSGNRAEPVAIWKARKYIDEHSREELSLTRVAKAVNMNANHLSENFKQVTGINLSTTSRTLGSKTRVISCEIHGFASVKSRSLRGFSRSRNSIACLRDSPGNRRRSTVLPSVWIAGIGRIPVPSREKTRKNA